MWLKVIYHTELGEVYHRKNDLIKGESLRQAQTDIRAINCNYEKHIMDNQGTKCHAEHIEA